MEWVEITAASVEEAQDKALDTLGVDEGDAEFEIIEEPRQGLFGRTRGQARIRARVAPKTPRSKDDRRDRKRRSRSKSGAGKKQDVSSEPAKETPREDRGRSERPASSEDRSSRRPRPQRSDRERQSDASLAEVHASVETFLSGLVSAFGIDDPVVIDADDEEIMARIEGKHGLLLGPKARTLDAIQDLTRITAQRTAPSSIRIKVDVGGYREARRESLVSFARAAATRARDEQSNVVLDAMSAADRKVVHDALNDEPGVTTRSDGADPNRHVVVIPDATSDDD